MSNINEKRKNGPPHIARGEAATRLSALGHPTRLGIIDTLVRVGEEGLSAGALATTLGTSAALMSSHLRILEHADLISRDRIRRTIVCRVRTGPCSEVAAFLDHLFAG